MLTIYIKEYPFVLSEPYSAGTVITAEEAFELNRLRAENIRNNIGIWVNNQIELSPDGVIEPGALAELKERVQKFDREYRFTKQASRKKQRLKPVEIEAQELAEEQARKEGWLPEQPDWPQRVMELLLDPELQKKARERVQVAAELAEEELSRLLG